MIESGLDARKTSNLPLLPQRATRRAKKLSARTRERSSIHSAKGFLIAAKLVTYGAQLGRRRMIGIRCSWQGTVPLHAFLQKLAGGAFWKSSGIHKERFISTGDGATGRSDFRHDNATESHVVQGLLRLNGESSIVITQTNQSDKGRVGPPSSRYPRVFF